MFFNPTLTYEFLRVSASQELTYHDPDNVSCCLFSLLSGTVTFLTPPCWVVLFSQTLPSLEDGGEVLLGREKGEGGRAGGLLFWIGVAPSPPFLHPSRPSSLHSPLFPSVSSLPVPSLFMSCGGAVLLCFKCQSMFLNVHSFPEKKIRIWIHN